jgi:hypothetical protein
MSRMMDVRDKIVAMLNQDPGKRFSVTEIAHSIGSSPKATTAALGRLFKKDLIARPEKGLYSSKGSRPPTHKQAKPRKIAEIPKTAKSGPLATPVLSVVSIDLLVQGEKSRLDLIGFLGKIRENKEVIDTKVRKVTEADQSKLQKRFILADED